MSTFLLISPEPWNAHAVSKHHYALTLVSRGHTVLFLNPPTAVPDITLSHPASDPKLVVVDAPQVARGLRFMPGQLRRALEARWLERLERAAGTSVDVVWLFENSRFFDMRFAGGRLKIYHQVDLNQHFHAHAAARSADVCFCTTDIIRHELLKATPRVHKIHHGTPFVPAPPQLSPGQAQNFAGAAVHAAYIGNLDMEYIDSGLLVATMKAYPEVRFHLIGGYSASSPLRRLGSQLPNVVWWGKQAPGLIPSLLDRADVVMCTYQASRYRDQASPHKFMEYFASGRVIVSTYTDEYKDKRDLLVMVDDAAEYIDAFGRVIADLPAYNSADLRARRKAFAEQNTYSRQLDRIVAIASREAAQSAQLFAVQYCADT